MEEDRINPAQFQLENIELYLHPKQQGRTNVIRGQELYEHLTAMGTIHKALGFSAGSEIVKRRVWLAPWAGKGIVLWKGVMQYFNGGLRVPVVVGGKNGVCLTWYWLDSDFGIDAPAGLYREYIVK